MGGHHSVPMFCFQNGLLISLHCFLFNSSTPESFVNILKYFMHWVSQVVLVVKNPSASAGVGPQSPCATTTEAVL